MVYKYLAPMLLICSLHMNATQASGNQANQQLSQFPAPIVAILAQIIEIDNPAQPQGQASQVNSLSTLPAGIFDNLTPLEDMSLGENQSAMAVDQPSSTSVSAISMSWVHSYLSN